MRTSSTPTRRPDRRLDSRSPHLPAAALLVCLTCCAGPGRIDAPIACHELDWDGPRRGSNVVIVINDAMRRDRVGGYGGPAKTPAFDRFSSENLRFDHAFTQAPWTKPSMATLFTSLYPSQHGVLSHPEMDPRDPTGGAPRVSDALRPELVTLAEVLRSSGYQTAAFVSNPWLDRRLGFDQGFEVYDQSFAAWDAPGEVVTEAALSWLAGIDTDRPYFLFVHYMDSHRPYTEIDRWDLLEHGDRLRSDTRPVEPFIAEAIGALVRFEEGLSATEAGVPPSRTLLELVYDRGIERFDGLLAELLEALTARADFESTAVVVTSDHGEALFERGYDNHGRGLYDDEVAIPFAARLPGVRSVGSAVDCPIGLVDVMPSLLSLVGAEPPEPLYGLSLFDRPEADPTAGVTERRIVTEGVGGKPYHRAVRNRTHKLILQPQGGPAGAARALYRVESDPLELDDLLAREPVDGRDLEIAESLFAAGKMTVPAVSTSDGDPVELDPELEERLRSLGYIE